ncbi:hypothetical protein [Phytohabitans suffuscus]|uniref:Uncharacterized protein n=1 Tax=Phytohabitans suffuscus TaxID=624315 RepID=A0A6F8YEZ7_9ACTN|nr:hypothetical protein [Phytohabitans suffuscus]BCB84695.1 hypothetical protein Psuf_020080 [Phytohabitans suffuscus]
MTTLDDFRPVAEVTADERSRIAFGKLRVHKGDRYAVSVNADGAILLTPLASIPARELLVWENDELRAGLFRGLADAAEGKVKRLDWVTQGDDLDGEDDE